MIFVFRSPNSTSNHRDNETCEGVEKDKKVNYIFKQEDRMTEEKIGELYIRVKKKTYTKT